ncbi:hypothetical protein GCM10028778_23920 [Barrientosiimonas marina]|uniref:DUF3899 domain-containing protein n=1 Tax=Lentibacillus kimchii TaxID=1542911 RepID=A0ABW2UVL9_9BACI
MLKRNVPFFAINMFIISLLVYWTSPGFTLRQFLNTTFYVSMVYLLISLAAYTIKGGFYDGIAFGLRRSRHVISKHKESQDESREKPRPSEKINHIFYKAMWFQCLSLLGVLVSLLIIYNGS